MSAVATSQRLAYPELVTAAHAINDEHRQVEESVRAGFTNALVHAIEAGRKLIFARSRVDSGGWASWVEHNLPDVGGRTERLYRQLAAAADDGRFGVGNAVANLSINAARMLLTTTPANNESETSGASASVSRSRRPPSARQLAKRIIRALDDQTDYVDYDELVGAVADGSEAEFEDGVEWAQACEQFFADVRSEFEARA
jgi:hypothetical protein